MITDEMLAATLEQEGIHFVVAPTNGPFEIAVSPVALLSGLASSGEARMRLALIPLFLRCPHYAHYVVETMKHLTIPQQHFLCCYYTAAQLLQQKHHAQLVAFFGNSAPLPDLFEDALDLDSGESIGARLQQLADQQSQLTGRPINWYGAYEHAYNRLVRHEVQRRKWQRSQDHRLKNF